MDHRKAEETSQAGWWSEKLQGLSLDEACRVYVLNSRPQQHIAIPPVRTEEFVDGMKIIRYQNAVKRFSADEPDRKHCFSREELLAEAHRVTGSSETDAENLLHRLFAFQPDLTYSRYGAACKPAGLPDGFAMFGGTVSLPCETLKGELPEEWYISLQIPDEWIGRLVWSCRKPGMTKMPSMQQRVCGRDPEVIQKAPGRFYPGTFLPGVEISLAGVREHRLPHGRNHTGRKQIQGKCRTLNHENSVDLCKADGRESCRQLKEIRLPNRHQTGVFFPGCLEITKNAVENRRKDVIIPAM